MYFGEYAMLKNIDAIMSYNESTLENILKEFSFDINMEVFTEAKSSKLEAVKEKVRQIITKIKKWLNEFINKINVYLIDAIAHCKIVTKKIGSGFVTAEDRKKFNKDSVNGKYNGFEPESFKLDGTNPFKFNITINSLEVNHNLAVKLLDAVAFDMTKWEVNIKVPYDKELTKEEALAGLEELCSKKDLSELDKLNVVPDPDFEKLKDKDGYCSKDDIIKRVNISQNIIREVQQSIKQIEMFRKYTVDEFEKELVNNSGKNIPSNMSDEEKEKASDVIAKNIVTYIEGVHIMRNLASKLMQWCFAEAKCEFGNIKRVITTLKL